MNIRELYNKGYRRFQFSDGKTRTVIGTGASENLLFEVTAKDSAETSHIYYYPNGQPNIGLAYPVVTGVAEDGSMSEVSGSEHTKRDEIRGAVHSGLYKSTSTDVESITDDVMIELDKLVERWTDEETAEDVATGSRVSEGHEYVGMRFRVNDWSKYNDPESIGATGTVIKDDGDGAPGVKFDAPWEHLNDVKDVSTDEDSYTYFAVDRMEKLEENEQDTEVST